MYKSLVRIICMSFILCHILVSSESEPNFIWYKSWGDPNYRERIECVRHTSDGGFVIAGHLSHQSQMDQIYVAKTDAFGCIQWESITGLQWWDRAYHVEETTDGCYIVTGRWEYQHGDYDAFLAKYDRDGVIIWRQQLRYGSGTNNWGLCVQEIVDDLGNSLGYVVVGCTNGATETYDLYIVVTDCGGSPQWEYAFGSNQQDLGYCVQQVSYDPDFIVCGNKYVYGYVDQAWLLKVNQTGMVWENTFGGADRDIAYCVRHVDDGYALLGRYQNWDGDFDMWLVKTDLGGDFQWDKKYGGTGRDEGYSLDKTVDGGYVLSGRTNSFGSSSDDVFVVKTDDLGNQEWYLTFGSEDHDKGWSIDAIDGGIEGYIVAGEADIGGDFLLTKLGWWLTETNEPLSLAYNGNRHFVRQPSSTNFHLTYQFDGYVQYMHSSNSGSDWQLPKTIGEGSFPAICLASDNMPALVWIDEEGGLWYGTLTATSDWDIHHIYDPHPTDPYINTPPSVVITPSLAGDTVHIIATLYREDLEHLYGAIVEYAFHVESPASITTNLIEGGQGPDRKWCYNPSIAVDYENRLHAVWQRSDTICYAIRNISQNWYNLGWQFMEYGITSEHPFVETYGDRVFVVWQHTETSGKDDIWRGWRYVRYPQWYEYVNLSLTPGQQSLYPVNASGLVTLFADECQPPPPGDPLDIYWKRIASDPLNNISMSPSTQSLYSHASLRYNQIADNEMYVLWQEGNVSPYKIEFEKVYVPDTALAFYSSFNGEPEPSPYVISRDTFMDTWTIPVDFGNDTLTYEFLLDPDYVYLIKTVAYHENAGQWSGKLELDNQQMCVVHYNGSVPRAIEAWIPPSFYADGTLKMSFEKIAGTAVALGPIYVYRYEVNAVPGAPGGPMLLSSSSEKNDPMKVGPVLFADHISIAIDHEGSTLVTIRVYDINGRLVKEVWDGAVMNQQTLTWSGTDNHDIPVSAGVYFIEFADRLTGEHYCKKVVKVR